jgi:hypothetical protein
MAAVGKATSLPRLTYGLSPLNELATAIRSGPPKRGMRSPRFGGFNATSQGKVPHASPNPLRAATCFCRDGPRDLGPENPHTRSRKHGLESVHLCMYPFDKSSKFAITWLMTCGGIHAIYQLARSLWVERVCQLRVIAQDDYVSSPKFAPRIPHLAPVTPK